MTMPYENATSGVKARDEITKILRNFGCSKIGFSDDYENKCVDLAFTYSGRQISMRASAEGWAAMYLKAKPFTSRMRKTRSEHEQQALDQGMVAVSSILRDWVKGQITAVECGMMKFEHVFALHIQLPDGSKLIDSVDKFIKLPAPECQTHD